MFGFSFGKLLVFAAVVAVVFIGWRKLSAIAGVLQRPNGAGPGDAPKPDPRAGAETVDLVRDPVTGRYEPTKRD